MLTPVQKKLLDMIVAHQAAHGTSPSYGEMQAAMALASKSGIHRLLAGLEERGFIRRMRNRARAIEVLRRPQVPNDRWAAFSNAELLALMEWLPGGGERVIPKHTVTAAVLYREVRDAVDARIDRLGAGTA